MPFTKKATADASYNLGILLKKRNTVGDVGIEIEVEGKNLPKVRLPSPWTYHPDGSLRGEDSAEYVLQSPIPFDAVKGALAALWEAFKANGSTLDDSNRTSVHIHLNCQKFHLNRATAFMAMYFALEVPLTAWCGEHRVGNLFCLRAKDAPAIVTQMKRFIQANGRYALQDYLHYAGLNANALTKFGSLEVRSLRGVSDPRVIEDWVAILRRLYELSAEFPDPREIMALFSAGGPLCFFETILGDTAEVVRRDCGMTNDDLRDSIYDGMRLAQDLCYCRDWSMFNPVELKEDPFGRDPLRNLPPIAAVAPSPYISVDEYEPEYDGDEEEDPAPLMTTLQALIDAQSPQSVQVVSNTWSSPPPCRELD